jgi:hypothetical protein
LVVGSDSWLFQPMLAGLEGMQGLPPEKIGQPNK